MRIWRRTFIAAAALAYILAALTVVTYGKNAGWSDLSLTGLYGAMVVGVAIMYHLAMGKPKE